MLLEEVKNKKEFRGLSDVFVARVIALRQQKYNVYVEKEKKLLIKEARAVLREVYGAYLLPGYWRKEKYLQKMETWNDTVLCSKILSLHLSSKERLPYYQKLYQKLQEKIRYKTVLDLGCGLNVFSLPWMGKVAYYGVDVNKDDVEFCNTYLQKFGLVGGIRWGDLLDFDTFVKTDVCFLLKVLEGVETVKRGSTEKVLKKITSPYIVASFATQTLSGSKRISPRRLTWFEALVPGAEKFVLGPEVYYLIENNL